jgi:hypothetical protein
MSGYEVAFGPCWSCGTLFTFDADLVPSLPVDPSTNTPADVGAHSLDAEYVKQPICRTCVERANENRRAHGRPLIDVLPGAYLDEG